MSKWVELIAGEIASNYLIDRYYSVTFSGGVVTLTARAAGIENTLGHTAEGIGGITVSSVEGVNSYAQSFFKVGVQAVLGARDNSQVLGEEYLPVDSDGAVTFDLHEFFSGCPSTTFSFPPVQNIHQEVPKSF